MPSPSSKVPPPPYSESSDNHHQNCSFPTRIPSPVTHLSLCEMGEQHNLDGTLAGLSKLANSSGCRALTISSFENSQTRAETDPTKALTDPTSEPKVEEPKAADSVLGTGDIEAYPAETATKSQNLGERTKDFKNELNRHNTIGKVSKLAICLGLLYLIIPIFSITIGSLDLDKKPKLDAYKAAGWSAMIPVFASCTLDHFFPQNPPCISLRKWKLLKVLFSIWAGWLCGGAIGIAMTKAC